MDLQKDDSSFELEIPYPPSIKFETVKNNLLYPLIFGAVYIYIAIIGKELLKPIWLAIFIIIGLLEVIWLVFGISKTKKVFRYKMVLNDKGIIDGNISFNWDQIARVEFLEKVSSVDGAGILIYTIKKEQIRIIVYGGELISETVDLIKRKVSQTSIIKEEEQT